MATIVNLFLDSTEFSGATAVYTDIDLTIKAPDGFYTYGTLNREQLGGLLQVGVECSTITIESCQDPVNCVVSDWSEWSICSGGTQTRTRTIITPPSGGGEPCPVLTETQPCVVPPSYKIRSFVGNNVINQETCNSQDFYTYTESIVFQLTEMDGVTPKINTTGGDVVVNVVVEFRGCGGDTNRYPNTVTIPNGQSQAVFYNTGTLEICGGIDCTIVTDTVVCRISITPSIVEPVEGFLPICVPSDECISYTITQSTAPVGASSFIYIDCFGVTAGDNLSGLGTSTSICAQEDTIVLYGAGMTITNNGLCLP